MWFLIISFSYLFVICFVYVVYVDGMVVDKVYYFYVLFFECEVEWCLVFR